MGLSYTILAGFFQIAAIICGILAYNADKKVNVAPTSGNTFNINGDYVNRDKNIDNKTVINKKTVIQKDKEQEVIHAKKSDNNKILIANKNVANSGVNNGIINSGVNYGNQTVNNNYNEKEAPRQVTNNDLEYIKQNIPLDYKIDLSFVNSTQECINYKNQIISGLTQFGYKVANINSIGMLLDGRINNPGDRFYINKDESQKTAEIVIKEQK